MICASGLSLLTKRVSLRVAFLDPTRTAGIKFIVLLLQSIKWQYKWYRIYRTWPPSWSPPKFCCGWTYEDINQTQPLIVSYTCTCMCSEWDCLLIFDGINQVLPPSSYRHHMTCHYSPWNAKVGTNPRPLLHTYCRRKNINTIWYLVWLLYQSINK